MNDRPMELLNYYFQTSTSFQPLFYQLKYVISYKILRRNSLEFRLIPLLDKL
ncbi:MAG: hypothetical protein HC894_05110 [Microcoleus sp. SM1_3_4]|nr:hypothetical protein [Microcoleus sp. SM1_3_4]